MIPICTGWANHSGEKERKGKKDSIRDLNWLLNSDCCWWYCWYWMVSYQSFANQTTFGRFHHFTYYSMPIDQNDIIFLYFFSESFFFSFPFFSFHFSSSRVTCWKLMLNWRVLGQSVESIPWWIYERHRMCRHTTFKNLSIRVFKMHEIDDEIDGKHIRNQKIQFTCSFANAGAYDRAYRERLCYS